MACRGIQPFNPRGRPRVARGSAIACALLVTGAFACAAAQAQENATTTESLKKLSIDELMGIEVTSVSRTAEPLSQAAAAIYVITREDIARSGASSLPELLRLAPNLQVAQVTASSYAITARGFNSTAANKLLVLIDGRSVYTPLFSGVFWVLQAVMPEDIERIEVISGPGAALWGPNAVNGVINIITRSSRDTPDNVATVVPGDFERAARLRHGGTLGDNTTWRIYGMGFQRDDTVSSTGTSLNDDWHNLQGGFRVDSRQQQGSFTLQGDYYDGDINQNGPANEEFTGHNLLGRWTRNFDEGSELQVQTYYDYSRVVIPGGSGDKVAVYDLDIQDSFAFGQRHHIVWGGGYRLSDDNFINAPTGAYFDPISRTLTVGSLFAEDTITLTHSLQAILGTKLEDNNYTGFQAMPSGRLSWNLSDTQLLWTAVSRAVRTPARVDRDVYQNAGPIVVVGGGPDFKDEDVTAFELGFRTKILSRASLSVSTFYNDYSSLRTLELSRTGTIPYMAGGRSGFLPLVFGNTMLGHTYGVEVWGDLQVTERWRLTASYNALRDRLRFQSDSLDIGGIAGAGDDPRYQASLRSSVDLPFDLKFDVSLRRVGALPNPAVPAYTEANARLGWQLRRNLELSLAGFNLLHEHHQEFGTDSEVSRSGNLAVRWSF